MQGTRLYYTPGAVVELSTVLLFDLCWRYIYSLSSYRRMGTQKNLLLISSRFSFVSFSVCLAISNNTESRALHRYIRRRFVLVSASEGGKLYYDFIISLINLPSTFLVLRCYMQVVVCMEWAWASLDSTASSPCRLSPANATSSLSRVAADRQSPKGASRIARPRR